MEKEIIKDKLRIDRLILKKKVNINVDGDMIVPDSKPDILSIISTSGCIAINKKEIVPGKIRISGNINSYIMYLSDDPNDKIRGINNNVEFSENIIIEEAKENMRFIVKSRINNIETEVINGRKINTKVLIELDIELYEKEEIETCNDINHENLIIKEAKKEINTLMGEGNTIIYAKDTIMIDKADELAEILKADIIIKNQDIQTSYNKILVKAEAKVDLLYLTQDSRIGKAEKDIPIVGFIDMQNINEESKYILEYNIKNVIIKPNKQEEHSIYIEVETNIDANVYEKKEMNIIEDLYGTKDIMSFKKKKIKFLQDKEVNRISKNIKDDIKYEDIDKKEIIDIYIRPDIHSDINKSGILELSGNFEVEILVLNQDKELENRNVRIPFDYEIEEYKDIDLDKFKISIDVSGKNCIIQSENSMNLSIDFDFVFEESKIGEIDIIEDIKKEKEREKQDYSILMYITQKGDSLWKIAKKFGSTVEDIAILNGIEDVDQIGISQRIFIPSYKEENKKEYV